MLLNAVSLLVVWLQTTWFLLFLSILSAVSDFIATGQSTKTFSRSSQNAQQCIIVTILEDDIIEGDETVIIRLTAPGEAVNFITDTAPLIITDNDGESWRIIHFNKVHSKKISHKNNYWQSVL